MRTDLSNVHILWRAKPQSYEIRGYRSMTARPMGHFPQLSTLSKLAASQQPPRGSLPPARSPGGGGGGEGNARRSHAPSPRGRLQPSPSRCACVTRLRGTEPRRCPGGDGNHGGPTRRLGFLPARHRPRSPVHPASADGGTGRRLNGEWACSCYRLTED